MVVPNRIEDCFIGNSYRAYYSPKPEEALEMTTFLLKSVNGSLEIMLKRA